MEIHSIVTEEAILFAITKGEEKYILEEWDAFDKLMEIALISALKDPVVSLYFRYFNPEPAYDEEGICSGISFGGGLGNLYANDHIALRPKKRNKRSDLC